MNMDQKETPLTFFKQASKNNFILQAVNVRSKEERKV